MPTVGLVGGLGPESTIDYYRRIIAAYQLARPDKSYPHIVIDSLDVTKGIYLSSNHLLDELTEYLAASVQRLARAGADFGAMTANTAHLVFDEVNALSPIPLISIPSAACAAAQSAGLKRVAILGTRMTMQADFYPKTFAKAGIAVVAPAAADQDYVHDKYIHELLVGDFRPDTREGLLGGIDRLRDTESIDGVVLAGTELPLIITGETYKGLPLLDTTQIHVNAIVEKLIQ